MLDPDLVAEYEAWKQEKLIGQTDLSIKAFNAEMEIQALAWEHGVKQAREIVCLGDRQGIDELYVKNPYRGAGMRGEMPAPSTKRVTS